VNVLLVNSADSGGGAEQVVDGLLRSYQESGHDTWLAVGQKKTDNERVFVIERSPHRTAFTQLGTRVARAWTRRMGHENFRFPGTRLLLDSVPSSIDLVHCHNTHGNYFDLRYLAELSARVPVVLTLHDSWLLSGHCAHSFECDQWKTGCGHCPDLTIYPAIRRDGTAYNWRRKRAIFASSQIFVATPSRWLMNRVDESLLVPAIQGARVIPNGIDLCAFRPGDRDAARASLGLAASRKIVLFAANGLRGNPFKDYATLRAGLEMVSASRCAEDLLVIGLGEGGPTERISGVELRFVPFEPDRRRVAAYFQASDIYVHAARAETFPNTILEAGACGTPVVASSVGGIPEQIRDGETGFLVPLGDPAALAERLIQLLCDDELRTNMGARATDAVRAHFGEARMTTDYLDWFAEILAARTVNAR
jgi:glycosyltransferase involved in cell wall biosynthesis